MAPRDINLLAGLFVVVGVAFYSCSSDKRNDASAGNSGTSTEQNGSQTAAAETGGTNAVESPVDAGGSQTAGDGGPVMSGSGGQAEGTGGVQPDASVVEIDVGVDTQDAGDLGDPVDAGPPDIPCDPADQTPPPTVIEYSGKDSVLFENGAAWYEPEAVTGVDTPNTGPYQPIIEVYPDFDQFTIYRPESIDRLLPIIAWTNGGCFQHGTFHGEFLKEIASYGFLIIADGAPGDPDAIGGPMSPGDGTQQKIMLDWAIAENERPCSAFYHKLDINKIAVSGNSCGGIMTMYAAPDPRVTTAVLWNSGLFVRDQPLYDSLHAPMAIFDGGPDDMANPNAQLDFEAINTVPILFANDRRGHGSYLWDDNGGEAAKVGVAWLNWFLLGDEGPTGKGMFVGDACGMCTNTDVWPDMQWKNLELM